MRLAANSRIAGILAVAAMSTGLAPGTSSASRLMTREVAHRAQPSAAADGGTVQPSPERQAQPGTPVGPPILRAERAPELGAMARDHEAALSYRPPAGARYSGAEMSAYTTTQPAAAPGVPSAEASGRGFDYGDAAVGSAIAAAVTLLITAGALSARRRGQPQHS